MPLRMGGVETERAQLFTWDPDNYEEAADQRKEIARLLNEGFTVESEEEGEVRLLPPERNPFEGCMRKLSQNGDDRVVWDRRNPDEVKDAYKTFNELLEKGYRAYATNSDGSKGHEISEFNPGLEEIIMVPATVPG